MMLSIYGPCKLMHPGFLFMSSLSSREMLRREKKVQSSLTKPPQQSLNRLQSFKNQQTLLLNPTSMPKSNEKAL